jgi:CDP-diglyceride synthetase
MASSKKTVIGALIGAIIVIILTYIIFSFVSAATFKKLFPP